MTPRKARNTTDMIVVFMGYDNGRELIRPQSQTRQPPRRLRSAEPAIKHDNGVACLDHKGIAATTAAETSEPQCV